MSRRIFFNYVLYSSCFVISLYLHKGTALPHEGYNLYYSVFIISWLLAVLVSRKYKTNGDIPLLSRLYTYTVSFFMMLGILSFIIYYFNLLGVSRFIILNSLLMAFVIEVSFLLYRNKAKINLKNLRPKYSIRAFAFEFSVYGLINLFLIDKLLINLAITYDVLLFVSLYLSWFVGSFWGHQFHPAFKRTEYLPLIWKYIKSYLFIIALSIFSTFMFRLKMDLILYILLGIITYSILSFLGISFYYYIKKHRKLVLNTAGFPLKYESGDVLLDEQIADNDNHYRASFEMQASQSYKNVLKEFSLKRFPKVFEFLNGCIDLDSFDNSYSMTLKSGNTSNIDYLPNKGLQILINLYSINEITEINDYLSEVNKKLSSYGIYIGNLETSYLRHQTYLKKYPYYFAQLFYIIDYLWNGFYSRIPILNKIYTSLAGKNRKIIPLAEGLGRIYYSGFEILHLRIIDNRMFFIAKKVKEPNKNLPVSTGLIFKMRRLGKNGNIIYVYKLRSMYPYSEFIQEFVYEKFNLKEGGKFRNDFRITFIGSILRKLWLDEIPMIYNLIKGDLKLVGFRPLSNHYYSLYKESLKEKRLKHKPGLIPPYYADVPKTLNEIMESEEKYLDSFEKNPIKTDVIYLLKCFNNILFKGTRSS